MTLGPVVVDTSVHIASEIFGQPQGPARETLARAFESHFGLALSNSLLAEIVRKLVECGAPASRVATYGSMLSDASAFFPDVVYEGLACLDAEDLFVLALGRTSEAWCIVSQDQALRDPKSEPPGWSPGFFLARLREVRGEPEGQRFPG